MSPRDVLSVVYGVDPYHHLPPSLPPRLVPLSELVYKLLLRRRRRRRRRKPDYDDEEVRVSVSALLVRTEVRQ